jgi:putative lipoprotein
MRRWVLILGLLSCRSTWAGDDPWLSPDKAVHASVSAGLASLGYWGGASVSDSLWVRLAAGAGLALTAGAAKELIDLAGWGSPSWKDFTWDVIGTAAGVLTAWLIDHFVIRPLLQLHPVPRGFTAGAG